MVRKVLSPDVDLCIGQPGYPNGRCIAISKAKKRENPDAPYDELRCKRQAVEGYRVCRNHGGGNAKNHGGRPVIHGRRSKYAGMASSGDPKRKVPGLRKKIDEFLSDERWMDLRREIALLRALLEVYLEKHEDDPHDEDAQKHIARMTDQIGILVDRLHKILYGEEYTINIYGIQAFAARVAEVLNKNILPSCCEHPDCLYFDKDLLLNIYQGLDEIFGLPVEEQAKPLLLTAGKVYED